MAYRHASGRIVTGQPMIVLVGDSLRAVLIIGVAGASQGIYWTLSDGVSTSIVQLVTGSSASPFQSIDDNLAAMQLGLSTIDTIEDGGNSNVASDLSRDKWMSGAGVAGPAVIAGALLLLNKIALALFIGFGPLFIICLLFKQTASLFSRWLLYGIGTLFSLAVLSVMITFAMQMLTAITAAYIAQYVASMATSGALPTDGLNSMALQQGGIGLILTTLIISAPPMAAAFFQGTLGQFQSYSPFGMVGRESAASAAQQQTALGQSSNTSMPANTSSESGGRSAGPGNTPQITGASGYGSSVDNRKIGSNVGLANGSGSMGPNS
jgi:type IV secretion system protein VirB6